MLSVYVYSLMSSFSIIEYYDSDQCVTVIVVASYSTNHIKLLPLSINIEEVRIALLWLVIYVL